jgi:hypothetical protein
MKEWRYLKGVNEETPEVTILRSLVTLFTIIAAYFLYKHHELDL